MSSANGKTVCEILQSAGAGDPHASEALFPLLYDELRRLARQQLSHERPGLTLQPTALVHEAYLRLVGDPDLRWESRGHFFVAAARVMRQILVDRARRARSVKHGGERGKLRLDEFEILVEEPPPEEILALHESLDRLESVDARQSRIVHLRYFAGLTIEETAAALGVSTTTVTDEWRFARAWLGREMGRGGEPES